MLFKVTHFFLRSDISKANCWDCNFSNIGKSKRRLRDRKTEHFKALTSTNHVSAISDHMTLTSRRLKCQGSR